MRRPMFPGFPLWTAWPWSTDLRQQRCGHELLLPYLGRDRDHRIELPQPGSTLCQAECSPTPSDRGSLTSRRLAFKGRLGDYKTVV
jgi:hypothetical protein